MKLKHETLGRIDPQKLHGHAQIGSARIKTAIGLTFPLPLDGFCDKAWIDFPIWIDDSQGFGGVNIKFHNPLV
ncbi:MAG: hypothetical protein EB073_05500 [Burkholderiaceae bacterium]|nr:hypothetical protein [Burkholderiaceae bacterium]